MSDIECKYHTPERDGHAPDDWDGNGVEIFFGGDWDAVDHQPCWHEGRQYRYRPLQYATVEPLLEKLKAQCLTLPEEERSALVEALQKPQRDWADEVWSKASTAYFVSVIERDSSGAAAVIRSMCWPKDVEINEAILNNFVTELDGLERSHIGNTLVRFVRAVLS